MTKNPAIALMVAPGGEKPPGGEVTFKLPEGIDLEEKKPGDTMEFVGEVKIGEDGMVTLTKFNGIEMGGEKEEAPPMDEEPEKGGFTDAVMGGPEAAATGAAE